MNRLLALACLLLSGCISTNAPAPDTFIRLEHEWISALERRDVAMLGELLDDSFIDSTFQGAVRTKSDVLAGPRAGAGYRSVALEDMKVRQYGPTTVIVTGVNVLQRSEKEAAVRVRFTDVFCKLHGRWRAVAAQETLMP